jgi:hypothetical protein
LLGRDLRGRALDGTLHKTKAPRVEAASPSFLKHGIIITYGQPHPALFRQPENWIKTLPDKGWIAYFRFYGPTQPYFDRTWALPDIVEVKRGGGSDMNHFP